MFTVYVCWMYLSNPIYLLHYASMYFSFCAFFVHRGYNGRIPYINAMVPQSLFSFNPDLTQAFSMQAQHRTEILRTSCRIHGLHQGALNPTWVWGDLGLGYAGMLDGGALYLDIPFGPFRLRVAQYDPGLI